MVGLADTPAPTPACSLQAPNPQILSLPAMLDLLLPSKHLAFHLYSILCPLAHSSWSSMQILGPSCGYTEFKHWADTSGTSVEGLRAELWGGCSGSLWLDCPLTCIVSQVPSAKFTQVAQSVSVETLLTLIPGWVEGPFSPRRSHVSLYHFIYLLFFLFSCLSPSHIPFPIWETLEKRNLCIKHLCILSTQYRSRHIEDKQLI